MDKILEGLSKTYTFDDFLFVTKRTKKEHWVKVRNVLERLDSMNNQLKIKSASSHSGKLNGQAFIFANRYKTIKK